MPKERRIQVARKEILPKVQDYTKTCKEGKPGCRETLAKAVKAYEETKSSFAQMGIPMPSANQIGYGAVRDMLNEHARQYGLME